MKETNAKKVKNTKEEESTAPKKSFPEKNTNSQYKLNSTYLYGVIIFLGGTLTSVLITQILPAIKPEPITNVTVAETNDNVSCTASTTAITRPTFAMYTKRKDQENLSVIRKILKLFGYTEVALEDDWNLLWGFENPFLNYKDRLMKLQPHQIVNHAPGMFYIVNKVDLSTSGSPYMPPAFRLPKDKEKFKTYAKKNPNKIFVEKGNGHRNVSIKEPQDIDLDSNTTFIQEFLTHPYLVDGYKFDIGIYTVITSVNPVRLYIYTGDVMFRYCREEFHPFDGNVLQKYVVGDHYRPTWEVPSLIRYFSHYGGGMRASFDAYVREQGQDPSIIWERAEEVIRNTVLSKATAIAKRWRTYPRQNFFELIRVDLIVDTDFKVHLIEANLSPNMHSRRFKHNYIVFEQVLYNAVRLVGVGSPIKEQANLTNFSQRLTAVTHDKNIVSNLNECVENACETSCEKVECSLCIPCLVDEDYNILAKAQREHIHRGDMKRIFPKPIIDVKSYDIVKETENLTTRNQWLTRWFYFKCLYDKSWCQ